VCCPGATKGATSTMAEVLYFLKVLLLFVAFAACLAFWWAVAEGMWWLAGQFV
jgi:hypothetical protein